MGLIRSPACEHLFVATIAETEAETDREAGRATAPSLERLERLEREIAALGLRLGRGMARWLDLIAELDRRGGGRQAGFRSTAEWLAWRCGISARAAREHVRVARGLQERGPVRAAFARGELSYSKVRALTRAGPREDVAGLLEIAARSTADQLERTVRSLRSAPSAGAGTAAHVHERRRLDWWWELDGSFRLIGRLPPDDGAALAEVVDTAAEALKVAPACEGEAEAPAGRPPLAARRADALAEIAQSGAPRAHVVLHVDPAALACTAAGAEDRAGELCALQDAPAVPSETARRLACDAELSPASRRPDGVLDRGRSRRVVSPALRASLERRDQGCRFPGCDRRHGLHAHHIEHWAHGGPTDRGNLVLVCRYHHRLLHEGGFSLRRHPQDGTLHYHRPDGRLLTDLPPPATAPAAAVA